MLPRVGILCGCLLMVVSFGSRAEMYKQVDEQGRVTYSNVPIKGAKKVDLQPLSVVPGGMPASKESAPRESVKEAPARENETPSRRKALEEALANEENQLAAAKQALKDGQDMPEVFKTTIIGKDGKPQVVTRRAYGRYEEKVKTLQDDVTLHEKNIEAIKKELATLP